MFLSDHREFDRESIAAVALEEELCHRLRVLALLARFALQVTIIFLVIYLGWMNPYCHGLLRRLQQ